MQMTLPVGFILKKFIAAVLLPPIMPMLCIAVGLLLLRKRPRLAGVLAWGGLLILWLLGTRSVVAMLAAPLEAVHVLKSRDLARAEAIVILAAGQRRYMPEYAGATPNRMTLERLRYGAVLARRSGLPILVSGGAPTGERPEAELMAESLKADFGIEPRWIEAASLDTAENAVFAARMLREAGIKRIVLVTHAVHMRRALGEFADLGLEVIPAPTAFLGNTRTGEEFYDYLPTPSAAYDGWLVTHEWLGLLAQRLRRALL